MTKGRGDPHANIMLIGEAWGSQEQKEGRPFVGPAGRVLSEMLMKSGINPDDCYYTNIVNDRPPENDLSEWIPKMIPNERVLDGIDSLLEEVESVNPNIIIPLGNWPLWFFYGQKTDKGGNYPIGITDYRGYILEARKICKGRKIMPTFHPSYYLRGKFGETGLGVLDFKKAAVESRFPQIKRQPRNFIIDPQGDERDAVRHRLLHEGDILFVDIEYIGTSLKCIGFGVSPEWATTIKIRSQHDLDYCRSLIESGKPLGAQNAMFDFGILEWHYDIHGFENLRYDTMVAAYVLNIEHKKDLGFLGGLYTDMPAWWDVISWDKIIRGEQSIDELLPYNCGDNVVTVEVAQKQQIELASNPKLQAAFEFDMAKLWPLWKIARRGVAIDSQKLIEIKAKVTHEIDQGQAALNELVDALGMDRHKGMDFNVKSPLQVPELLAAWLGVELTKRTKGDAYWDSSNVMLMEYMRRSDSAMVRNTIEKIIQVREARDIDSKWGDIEWDTDQRARCIYDATKTVTRRLSSKKFFPTGKGTNLQNIPAPNSSPRYGGLIRGCFVPDPGFEFGYADLKGAEFLVVAWLTQDPLMLKYAQMSIDGTGNVHKETASYLFNKPVAEIDKDSMYYFLGKKMRHSGNYMIGWKELMGRINGEAMETGVWVDAAQTKKLIRGYTDLHPYLPHWWDEVQREVRETGRLKNLFGFIRVVNDRNGKLPELVAFIPQSTVGDLLNMGLLACENDLILREYGFQILLQVHDAIGFQYNPSYRTEVLTRVRQLMSIPIYIPKTAEYKTIPIEIQTGAAWHPLTEWRGLDAEATR